MSALAQGRTALASMCLTLALMTAVLASCSQDGSDATADRQGRPDGGETVSLISHEVATQSQVARVYGRLPRARRHAVRQQVTRVVDRWWESAFLGGDYPRSSFPAAFPGFTRGAEERARRDKVLMTNLDLGARIESVTARHRRVDLDVLAVRGAARSVTARFVLRFRTAGEDERLVNVRGRLFLTRRPGGWRVFGYDVAKGSRP